MSQTVLRKLTKDEIDQCAQELARETQMVVATREAMRESAAEYRKEIRAEEAHIQELAQEIRTGLREEEVRMALPRIGKDKASP